MKDMEIQGKGNVHGFGIPFFARFRQCRLNPLRRDIQSPLMSNRARDAVNRKR